MTLAGGVSGSGGLVKARSGLLALTGNAAYTGNTTVSGRRRLKFSQANAANDSSAVTIAATVPPLELDFVGNDTVLALVLDGVTPAGWRL